MNTVLAIIAAFIIGALLVFITIPIIVRISKAKKLFDYPDERKVNKSAVPNLGGVSIFIGISIATLLSLGNLFYPEFRSILSAMIILLFIGIKDDIMVISPRKKFLAQIICALILIIAGNIRFTNLHGILGINDIGYGFSFVFSLLSILAIINAANLIDGIDGLAASIGILISLIFGVLFFSMGNITYSILCFAVIGSLTSYFFYNVFGKENKIFMGDTGSLIIGLLVTVFVIKYNEFALTGNEQVRFCSPVLSMAIISIPFFDMIRVFCTRIIQKNRLFSPI
jgi:UDP-GlcNAc:undecaprenyl-phosphate/decaprenyl-phosphate GlcNAc-1-phosphate transferase